MTSAETSEASGYSLRRVLWRYLENAATSVGRYVLRVSPFVHSLVVVGLFVSLCANLLVAFYTTTPPSPWMLMAALLMLVCAGLYLPIIIESDRTFREERETPAIKMVATDETANPNRQPFLTAAWSLVTSFLTLIIAIDVLLLGK